MGDLFLVVGDWNRDVWNDPDMQDIVRSSFLFWQQLEVSQEGALFCQRYRVTVGNCAVNVFFLTVHY